ncbi:hypothetical protein PHYPSEUDO_009315 [Phytophthora pseudosyringae]|uniref:M96 mating-specific protein family n=1 Tax=Phytophthora pseudosyringae TaxID=221518 RepID=A0A8T1VFJ7_9STRA|nr:hypothetical protein PHYPSEUDO_009315 [Phytophthora pseudosyringae]
MNEQHSPLLSEDALMAVVDDVWSQWSPRGSPFAGADAATTATKTKRRRDRNRPRHEIARLQAEAEELERELENRLARASKSARSSLRAHVGNAELRALVRTSIEDSRALQQNLSQQVQELVRMLPRSMNVTPRNVPFDTAQDHEVLLAMARSVDEQYQNMEHALRLAGLDGTTSEVADAFVCRSKSVTNGDLLTSRTRVLSPFKSCSLVRALWRSVDSDANAALRSEQGPEKLELPLGRQASRISIQKYEVLVGDHVCTMRKVMKQYIEKDRVAQVWSVLADWALVGGMCDVQTHEQGWGFIQPVNENSSVCLSYSLMNPTLHPRENCEPQLEFLANLYQDMIISRLHLVENQTLDQVMQETRAQQSTEHPSPSGSPARRLQVSGYEESVDAGQRDTSEPASTEEKNAKKKCRRDRNGSWHEIPRLGPDAARLERELQEQATKASKSARHSLQVFAANAELKTLLRKSFKVMGVLEHNVSTQTEELVQAMTRSLVATSRYDMAHSIFTMIA